MERNDSFGTTGAGQTGGMGIGGTPSQAGSQSMNDSLGAGSDVGMPGERQGGAAGVAHHLADKAQDFAGNASSKAQDLASQGRDAVSSGFGTAKDRAAELKTTLADKLQQGAEALRRTAQPAATPGGPQFAGAPATGAAASLLGNPKVQGYSNQLAGGMQGAADFLRDGDLQGSLEKQVRENPARTLLIALGLGYVIGKAVRK